MPKELWGPWYLLWFASHESLLQHDPVGENTRNLTRLERQEQTSASLWKEKWNTATYRNPEHWHDLMEITFCWQQTWHVSYTCAPKGGLHVCVRVCACVCGCTGISGTDATPFFISLSVPPCYSGYLVIGNGIPCLVLRAQSDTFMPPPPPLWDSLISRSRSMETDNLFAFCEICVKGLFSIWPLPQSFDGGRVETVGFILIRQVLLFADLMGKKMPTGLWFGTI